MDRFPWKRFRLEGGVLLFKSSVAMAHENKHYNRWYEAAVIPTDLRHVAGGWRGIARAFVAGGHKKLTEEEVRVAMLDEALTR